MFRSAAERFRSHHSDSDLADEIRSHLDEAAAEQVRRGMSPAEARRAALLEFGSVVQAEMSCWDVRGRKLQDLSKDVRYALRSLRRGPAFAVIAVVSLAVGIGANTAVFSLVNSLLWRPRPVAEPNRLVELYTGRRDQPYQTFSYPSYIELRDRNGVLSGLAAYSVRQFRLGGQNHVEEVWGEAVSGNYFKVLGVRPQHGRPLGAADDLAAGANPVVVVGHGLWQRRFSADPHVVGRTVTVNGLDLLVVGIAPPQHTGMMRGLASELWVPVTLMPLLEPTRGQALLTRNSKWLTLPGRLDAGTTIERARARFDLLSREMQALHPDEWSPRDPVRGTVREEFVTVVSESRSRIHPGMQAAAYAVAGLIAVVVNLVLVVACTNLAGLLLARGVARRREVAVRLAIGASRWRIVRQALTESLVLALAAGAVGAILTAWLLSLLVATIPALPEGIHVAVDLRPDWRVFVYAIAFSTLTGILFGLAPALQISRVDVSSVLANSSGQVARPSRRPRGRTALVVCQVAFSVLLLVGAGLTFRSLEKLRPTRLGFDSGDVVVAPLKLDEQRYDRGMSHEFYRRAAERVSMLPGVKAVSLVEGMPGGFLGRLRRTTDIDGYQPAPGESMEIVTAPVRIATPEALPRPAEGGSVACRAPRGPACRPTGRSRGEGAEPSRRASTRTRSAAARSAGREPRASRARLPGLRVPPHPPDAPRGPLPACLSRAALGPRRQPGRLRA